MSNILDIGIIGAGVSGAFAALRISEHYPKLKTIIFDISAPPAKRRRFLEGWLGCLPNSNGRFYSSDLEKINSMVDGRKSRHLSSWVLSHLESVNKLKNVNLSIESPSCSKIR